MSKHSNEELHSDENRPENPGEATDYKTGLTMYAVGLLLAAILTGLSFWVAVSPSIWTPSLPALLAALAIGQMGVHLVFFLHISSGPESTNNILALTFGVFVVGLVVFGSLIIMANLYGNMVPMSQLLQMQR